MSRGDAIIQERPPAERRAGGQEAILRVEDLTTVFPGGRGVFTPVNGVSLDLRPREILGLVGESGSGKSMTLRSILRLVPPPGATVHGRVWLEERDLLSLSKREMRGVRGREISMVFQDPRSALDPVYTVGDQIMESLGHHLGLTGTDARSAALDLLRRVGISAPEQRLDAYPHQLSGGMRQRVMIAIAISCHPKVLLADEPTTALDVTIQDQILALLLELQEEFHMAVLLVSHDIGVVAETCDRVAVMYAGQIMETGSVQDLLRSPAHPYTIALLQALPDAPGNVRGGRLTPIRGQPPDLEALPPGCPFQPRCPHAREACAEVPMSLEGIAPGHATACPIHRPQGGEWS
ncbi:MAG: ABC transporter ATP-binding protein [Actinomycetota bacterium]